MQFHNPIIFFNPRGAVCYNRFDKFLLCKRAIEPQLGLWTYPAGFLENGESLEEGAQREAYEEAKDKQINTTASRTRINLIGAVQLGDLAKTISAEYDMIN